MSSKNKKEDKKEDKKDASGADAKKEGAEASGAEASGADASGAEADGDKKDGDSKGKSSGSGKCPEPKDPECIGKKWAERIAAVSPDKALEMVGKAVANKGKAVANKVGRVITDKVECIGTFTTELPNIIPNMIEKIGDSASHSIDKISASMSKLFSEFGREVPGYPDIFGPFEVLYAIIMIKLTNIFSKLILGSKANEIMAKAETTNKTMAKSMSDSGKKMTKFISSDEFQKVFKEWLTNYVVSLLTTLDIAEDQIKKVTDKIKDILTTLGGNLGKTVGAALINFLKSVIAEIPIVGGIADAIISVGTLANNVVQTCTPIVTKGAGVILPIANLLNAKYQKTKSDINCFNDTLLKPMMAKLDAMPMPEVPNVAVKEGGDSSESSDNSSDSSKMSGGTKQKINNSKVNRNKIHRATKRVQGMLHKFKLHKFTRRQKKPINYASVYAKRLFH
jgi:hypothetical protein